VGEGKEGRERDGGWPGEEAEGGMHGALELHMEGLKEDGRPSPPRTDRAKSCPARGPWGLVLNATLGESSPKRGLSPSAEGRWET